MLKIGLITDLPFWELGNGQNARIQELIRYLDRHSHFTLYYLGNRPILIPQAVTLNPTQPDHVKTYLKNAQHDLVIIEKLHLDWILDFLPKKTPAYLDAHDLMSDRSQAFQAFNRPCSTLSFNEEVIRMSKFDKVIFLQNEEVEKVNRSISPQKLLCCPHPIKPHKPIGLRKQVKHIGFFGGPSWPNIDGVQWFHDTVMPLLGKLAKKCTAQGTFIHSPFSIFTPRLKKGAPAACLTSYYQTVDIAFNPALYGSGLKIKTIEALGHGIPLVTTSCGAQGLLEEANRCFLIADTPEKFAEAIAKLASSLTLRQQLSKNALKMVKDHFSAEACFKQLLQK